MPVLGARDRTDMIGATRFEPQQLLLMLPLKLPLPSLLKLSGEVAARPLRWLPR